MVVDYSILLACALEPAVPDDGLFLQLKKMMLSRMEWSVSRLDMSRDLDEASEQASIDVTVTPPFLDLWLHSSPQGHRPSQRNKVPCLGNPSLAARLGAAFSWSAQLLTLIADVILSIILRSYVLPNTGHHNFTHASKILRRIFPG